MNQQPTQEQVQEALARLQSQVKDGEALHQEISTLVNAKVQAGMLPIIALGSVMAEVAHIIAVMVTLRALSEDRAPTEQEGRDLFKILVDKTYDDMGTNIRNVYGQATAALDEIESETKAA